MTKNLYLLLLAVALLTACRSSKKATETTSVTGPQTSVITEQTQDNSGAITAQTNMTAHVRVKLKYDGSNIGTSGTLRMRKGEVIQLALVDPILGISEVGRMEIDPNSILLIDRYNKRYVVLTYDDLNRYSNRGIDYQTIENYFWQQATREDTDQLQFQFPLGRKTVELTLNLSSKNDKSDWEAHTVPSYKYDQVSAEELFKSLSDF